jgi:hypothetical protein
MPLTKEQIAAYLTDPGTCLFCGHQKLDAEEPGEMSDLDGMEIMGHKACLNPECGKTWRDYYKLHDIEEEDADGYAIPNEGLIMADNGHTPGPWTVTATDQYGTYYIQEAAREQQEWVDEGYGDMETDEQQAEGDRRNEIVKAHDEGNRRLIAVAPDLVATYEKVEGGFLDALHALNDAGLPCPASLGLAIEKVRQIIAKAKETAYPPI